MGANPMDEAWDDYEHLNYSDEPDMGHVERAFRAGWQAALDSAGDEKDV